MAIRTENYLNSTRVTTATDYNQWLQKKVAKLEEKNERTSDDTFTKPEIYEEVLRYVKQTAPQALEGKRIIRPFYPGGDYLKEDYTNAVVIDNPPFSILWQIKYFYMQNNIPFFLFAPALTVFRNLREPLTVILPHTVAIEYSNGVKVPTTFISNLYGDKRIILEPNLFRTIKKRKPSEELKTPYYLNSARLSKYTKFLEEPLAFTDDEIHYPGNMKNILYGMGIHFENTGKEKIDKLRELYNKR